MQSLLIRELGTLLGPGAVLSSPEDLMLYEYDGSVELGSPRCIVFPSSAKDVAGIVRLANQDDTPIVGRGAGTGLSGGAIARSGGIVIAFSRMNRILEIDAANLRAVVQPGVVNLDLSRAVEHLGLYFAPDPSSQKSCTIGGNVSENSGGPHTLAYGVTTNHVTGLELVLTDGEIVRIGGKSMETSGYDLDGLLVGSEGTLALVTEITVQADAQAGSGENSAGGLQHSGRHDGSRSLKLPCGRLPRRPAKCLTDSRCAPLRITSMPDFPRTARRCC